MSLFIDNLEKFSITPNFWCSHEYFQLANLQENVVGNKIIVLDGEIVVFPYLDCSTGILEVPRTLSFVWSILFPCKVDGGSYFLLDYNYIYYPGCFVNMMGGHWQTFRKNVRKFPARYNDRGEFYLNYIPFEDQFESEFFNLAEEWFASRNQDEEIHDSDTLIRYLYFGKNRKILVDQQGKVLGVNIWDENFAYINFRFSLCKNIPFLSEYLRYRFYTDPEILRKKKLVNDGGILDNPSLGTFKDKMNPVYKKTIVSWKTDV